MPLRLQGVVRSVCFHPDAALLLWLFTTNNFLNFPLPFGPFQHDSARLLVPKLLARIQSLLLFFQGVVRSVCFHPNAQLLLTAGLDKTVRFFNVDGKKNPRVQSLFLEDMPVAKAAFTGDGRKVVAAGRRKWFYVVDLASARVERVRNISARVWSVMFLLLSGLLRESCLSGYGRRTPCTVCRPCVGAFRKGASSESFAHRLRRLHSSSLSESVCSLDL